MFGEKILDYWDDILADLEKIVAVPSVCGPAEGEYPYGKDCAKAIDTMIELAEGYGLKTKNAGYYAGHAEYGEGEENAVVLAHVDVVPAGEGWATDPFTMVIKDGKAFGRGVGDNKGPAIVALHCLRALKDAGIQGKRKLRVVFGSGEEIGMDDMKHYFASEQLPTMGFTPDAGYGICNCEKGIMDLKISGKNDSSVVRSFKAGTVANAVPSKAECVIACSADELKALEAAANTFDNVTFTVTAEADGAAILCKGRAAHASTPQNGVNAATHLVELLAKTFSPEKLGTFFTFVHEKIATCYDGQLIGVKMSDEPSGPLTFNLGLLSADEAACSLTIDIRYPATKEGKDISQTICKVTEACGLTFEQLSLQAPLYLPKESKLISLLSGAYEEVTGEKCEIFSMGGGTYARQMHGNGVAFGASFPDESDGHAHDVDERIDLRRFKLHAQICMEAMYRMFTAD